MIQISKNDSDLKKLSRSQKIIQISKKDSDLKKLSISQKMIQISHKMIQISKNYDDDDDSSLLQPKAFFTSELILFASTFNSSESLSSTEE